MHLSEKETVILRSVALKADLPSSALATLTGYREHTIRQTLRSLERREIITKQYYIDLFKIGLCFFDLYFSILPGRQKIKNDIIEFLLAFPAVAYLSELSGEYQFNVVLSEREHTAIKALIEALHEEFGNIFLRREIAQVHSLTDFTPYPLKTESTPSYLELTNDCEKVSVDSLELELLSTLASQQESKPSEIARKLGLPQSTVSYRLEQLRKKKLIVGTRYMINYSKLGLTVYSNRLFASSLSPESKEKIFLFCQQHPNINYIAQITGAYDYSIGTVVQNAEEQNRIIQELHTELADYISQIISFPISKWYRVTNFAPTAMQTSRKRHLSLIKRTKND